jgi:hypothetical protein
LFSHALPLPPPLPSFFYAFLLSFWFLAQLALSFWFPFYEMPLAIAAGSSRLACGPWPHSSPWNHGPSCPNEVKVGSSKVCWPDPGRFVFNFASAPPLKKIGKSPSIDGDSKAARSMAVGVPMPRLISPLEKCQLQESWAFLQWRNPDNMGEGGFLQGRNFRFGISPVEKSSQYGRGWVSPAEKFQLTESRAFLHRGNPDNLGLDRFLQWANLSSQNHRRFSDGEIQPICVRMDFSSGEIESVPFLQWRNPDNHYNPPHATMTTMVITP